MVVRAIKAGAAIKTFCDIDEEVIRKVSPELEKAQGRAPGRVREFERVLDDKGTELLKYDLAAKGSHTALVMGKVYRHNGGWKFHAVGEVATGTTVESIMPQVKAAC